MRSCYERKASVELHNSAALNNNIIHHVTTSLMEVHYVAGRVHIFIIKNSIYKTTTTTKTVSYKVR